MPYPNPPGRTGVINGSTIVLPYVRKIDYDADDTKVFRNGGEQSSGTKITYNSYEYVSPFTYGDGNSTFIQFQFQRPVRILYAYLAGRGNVGSANFRAYGWQGQPIHIEDGSPGIGYGLSFRTSNRIDDYRYQQTDTTAGWQTLPILQQDVRDIYFDYPYLGSPTLGSIAPVHFYGYYPAETNMHKVEFVDEIGNPIDTPNLGDIRRNDVFIWSPTIRPTYPNHILYVKNTSPEKTAVTVSLTSTSQLANTQNYTTYSLNDQTYASSLGWATLTPGQVIGPIYVKYAPQLADRLGPEHVRHKLDVVSWA